MTDYLKELGAAFPEVKTLDAYRDAVRSARSLERNASVDAALDLRPPSTGSPTTSMTSPMPASPRRAWRGPRARRRSRPRRSRCSATCRTSSAALSAVFATRPDDIWIPTSLTGDDGAKVQDAIDAFVAGDHTATRFYLTSASDPYSGNAFTTIKQARTQLADAAPAFGPAASAHIGGPTAQFADVQDTLAADFQKVGLITVIGILLVLIVLLRAIVAPLYLVATVLISYGSTLGLSAFLFQEVLGQPGISPYLPLMVFVLLVALGSDYNIFLMHRVREEAETRPMRDAVRIASGHTGSVITSAGLILAGTFGSMATASLMILFQVGVAVAIGVLIDTFLVRSILVPAITTLAGDWAWWPSGRRSRTAATPQEAPAGAGTGVPVAVTAATAAALPTVAADAALDAPSAGPRPRRRLAIAVGLVVLIPVLVGGLLTWSFGSASDNLASVQAAVVNLDQGGSVPAVDGSSRLLSLGNDIAAALDHRRRGRVHLGHRGCRGRRVRPRERHYAAVLTIPADFSRTVATIRTDPTGTAPKAALRVSTDDGSGYALGTVARAVTNAIGTTTSQDVTASYVDDVLVRISSAHDALAGAASDAGSLADDGASLADNARGVGVVADTVSAGLRQLADGASSAADGTTQLVTGTRQLATGAGTLAAGAADLATGARSASDGASSLATGAGSLADGLGTLEDQTADLPDQVAQLADGASGVASGAAGVADGAQQLADGLDTMASQTDGLGASAAALNDGAASLESGRATCATPPTPSPRGRPPSPTRPMPSPPTSPHTPATSRRSPPTASRSAARPPCATSSRPSPPTVARSPRPPTASRAAPPVPRPAPPGSPRAWTGSSPAPTASTTARSRSPLARRPRVGHRRLRGWRAADLASGAAGLSTGAQQLAGGTQQLADGMPALAAGIAKAADGGASLADGASSLAGGIDRLADGTVCPRRRRPPDRRPAPTGSPTAPRPRPAASASSPTRWPRPPTAPRSSQAQVDGLADDGDSLADRVSDLASGLGTSADSLTTYDEATRDRIGDLAANPVAVDATRVNPVSGAESGFAPAFMAIAAWLGALGAFLVLPAMWRRGDDRRWWLAALRSFGGASAIAIGGTVLMVIVLDLLLGVSVASPGTLLVFAVLAALAFTAVVQALVATFGTRGWLAALLLLVLGIAASGIGVDAAAVPGPLAAIRPLLPLTAATDAFRGAVVGAGGSLAIDAIVLLGWLVAGVLVTLAAAAAADRNPDDEAEAVAA